MISLYASELTRIGSSLRDPNQTPLGAIREVSGVTKFGGFAQPGLGLYTALCKEVSEITGVQVDDLEEHWAGYPLGVRNTIAGDIRRGGT